MPKGKPKAHHRRQTRTYGAVEAGGATLAGYGLLGQAPQPGWQSTGAALITPGTDKAATVYNLKQSIPIIGKDPNLAGNRATVGLGVGAYVAGKLAKRMVPSLHRGVLKLGRGVKLAVA